MVVIRSLLILANSYLVEVLHLDDHGNYDSGYFLSRRYSEFWHLNTTLRDKYGVLRQLEFPARSFIPTLSSEQVNTRRLALERWLQALLQVPSICASFELRSFLSQRNLSTGPASRKLVSYIPLPLASGQTVVKHLYRTVTSSVDEAAASQNVIEALALRLGEMRGLTGSAVSQEELLASTKDILQQQGVSSAPAAEYFTTPICDLIIELFELQSGNNWLRRQAILSQILGVPSFSHPVRSRTPAGLGRDHRAVCARSVTRPPL
jgi:sorting nexin-25